MKAGKGHSWLVVLLAVVFVLSAGVMMAFADETTEEAGNAVAKVTTKETTTDDDGNETTKETVNYYTELEEAIVKAYNGGTVEILDNIEIDTWYQNLYKDKDGKDREGFGAANNGPTNLTIKGNDKTLTIKEIYSNGNGGYMFYKTTNLNVENLHIVLPEKGGEAFDISGGKLTNLSIDNGNFVAYLGGEIEIDGGTFIGQNNEIWCAFYWENESTSTPNIHNATFKGTKATDVMGQMTFKDNTIEEDAGVFLGYNFAGAKLTNEAGFTGNIIKGTLTIWQDCTNIVKNNFDGAKISVEDKDNKGKQIDITAINLSGNYWGENGPTNREFDSRIIIKNYYPDDKYEEDLVNIAAAIYTETDDKKTVKFYKTIDDAVSDAKEDTIITLMNNVETECVLPAGKSIIVSQDKYTFDTITTVGGYAVKVEAADENYENTYKYTSVTMLDTVPAIRKFLVDNGQDQNLITEGTTSLDILILKYALGDNGTKEPDEEAFNTEIPTGRSAGTYYVWYKLSPDLTESTTETEKTPAAASDEDEEGEEGSITIDTIKYILSTKAAYLGSVTIAESNIPSDGGVVNVPDDNNDNSNDNSNSGGGNSGNGDNNDSDNNNNSGTGNDDNNNGNPDDNNSEVTDNPVVIPADMPVSQALETLNDEQRATATEIIMTPEQKADLQNDDVSKIVTEMKALEKLDLTGNKNVTEVNVESHANLQTLELEGCDNLSELSLSGCGNLTTVNGLNDNDSITDVEIKDCEKLEELDVSNCPELTKIDCSGNNLGSLKIDNCPKLEAIECSNNNLTNLNLEGCENLREISMKGNSIEEINLSDTKALTKLDCEDNSIQSLTGLENNIETLEEFNCAGNNLGALNMRGFNALKTLECSPQRKSERFTSNRNGSSFLLSIAEFILGSLFGPRNAEYSVTISAVTDGDLTHISYVKGIDSNGNEMNGTYDEKTGDVSFTSDPVSITYGYDTGYDNTIMAVSVSADTTDNNNGDGENETPAYGGGSSGGCNSFSGILSLMAIAFMLRKNVSKL